MTENNYNPYYNGAVYFVGTVMEDGNVAPITNPQSKEADESIVDLTPLDILSPLASIQRVKRIKANRPAVIIGREDCKKDTVLVAFLTRKKNDEEIDYWYEKFSPRQVEVQLTGGPAYALCSHIARVELDYLAEWMGDVTQDELDRIINKVQESKEFDEILPFLCRPENSRLEKEN